MNDPILLIFDIDGTLTDSGGLTRVALELAAHEIWGIQTATKGIAAWGQTDLNIFQLMVANNKLPVKDVENEFLSFTGRYVEHLRTVLFSSDKPRLHNGIGKLLEKLVTQHDICLALGTGNIEQTAWMKLQRHAVDVHFPVGGFGSDSSDRPTLLKVALERARKHYNQPFPIGSYWVIGDTPNDISSGKRIGAQTIAVCTGTYKSVELSSHNPTVILPDLSDSEYFLAIVRGEIEPLNGQANLFEQEVVCEEPDPL